MKYPPVYANSRFLISLSTHVLFVMWHIVFVQQVCFGTEIRFTNRLLDQLEQKVVTFYTYLWY